MKTLLCALMLGAPLATCAQTLVPFEKPGAFYSSWGYKNAAGEVVIPDTFGYAGVFQYGVAVAATHEYRPRYFLIDSTGRRLPIPKETTSPMPLYVLSKETRFSDGLARVADPRMGTYWGYIDGTGQLVIPTDYKNATGFRNGKAKVEKDGRSFYIDKAGKEVK